VGGGRTVALGGARPAPSDGSREVRQRCPPSHHFTGYLTKGLGQEEDTPKKEIGAVAELRLGLLGAAALRGEGEEERARESCGRIGGCARPFIW
jgi:hypothetical protein